MVMKMIDGYGPGATDEIIDFTEKNLRVKFPQEFIDCVKQTDRGTPERSVFEFVDSETGEMRKEEVGEFLSFNPENKFNILRENFIKPQFFPHTLLAFAGDGDYLCFDYSIGGFEDKNPPVVYWRHEHPERENIVDIAITFKEFLEKLKPGEYEA